ncbi:phosphodiesterase [Aestuariicoccus sp. MJ-SS9]|uniref:phosphodiesterase n=1 Tax=Aestuariicoccus sp. MJ-SS9 TaxID=3079855 RepID=UPI0029095E36|nr:phosphodiesterase [Aestuariicoccus sp. MJ-SS9]MDU8911935.1 phosphodiesterase [Aestuariicoccus sp. MJ-SS9]
MAKALILTDLHLTQGGQTIAGLDPAQRLSAALDHALARHSDAQAIVLLGDLTHHGGRREYAVLREILSDVALPVIPTLGNHDRRAGYYEVFPDAPRDTEGFAQSVLDLGTHRLIVLDTLDEDGIAPRHGGYLCDRRLGWLSDRLAEDTRPTAVLCHHPPFRTGFDGMDAIRLINGAALLDRLQGAPQVTQLICGHIHRTIAASVGRLAVSVLKSPCHQMPMILGPGDSTLSETGAGGYGILLATDGGFVLHSDDVTAQPVFSDPGSASG